MWRLMLTVLVVLVAVTEALPNFGFLTALGPYASKGLYSPPTGVQGFLPNQGQLKMKMKMKMALYLSQREIHTIAARAAQGDLSLKSHPKG